MEKKLTPKQQKFVYAYLETNNACEAYRQAYNTNNMSQKALGVEAWRLMAHPVIALEIENGREEARKRHEVTLESITQELDEARVLGIAEKQVSAAISASMGKAKLHGLVIERSNVNLMGLQEVLEDIDGRSAGLPKDQE